MVTSVTQRSDTRKGAKSPGAPLTETSRVTLDYYEGRADAFWQGTRAHDVSQNREALLAAIGKAAPLRILDLGCGPGRDLAEFVRAGHSPIGLDGASTFVKMAKAYAGVPVWRQDFLSLDLPAEHFDGVFANASLFHVPLSGLPRVLGALLGTLVPGGVLFASNPRGNNEESWDRGRFGVYHDLECWRNFVLTAGFEEIDHYYRPPGLPRDRQPWLATLWRRPAND